MTLLPPAPDRSLTNRFFYAVCRGIVLVVGKLAWVVKAYDTDRVPTTGPVILAPTHRSLLDIPFMGFVTNRPLWFMAKEELFAKEPFGKFISTLGGFPVKRGSADRKALAAAFAILEQGTPLVVFPEGTRGHGHVVEHIEEGVAYMAMKAGAPIVPIGVAGSEEILEKGRKLPRFTKVVVTVGDPIPVNRAEGRLDRVEMQAIVAQVHAGLQQEFDRAHAILEND